MSKKNKTKEPVEQVSSEQINEKVQRYYNTLPSLNAVSEVLASLEESISVIESPNFRKSLMVNIASMQKKLSDETINAKKREMRKVISRALTEGKEVIIKE